MRCLKLMLVLLSLPVLFPQPLIALDFGDLPDTYATVEASDGAMHTVDGATFLGSGVE